MPELPEVETIRRGLHDRVVGQTLRGISLHRPDMIVGCPDFFVEILEGRQIVSIGRRGKVMWLECGRYALAVHLGMSGRLHLTADTEYPPHTHVVLSIGERQQILYIDPRRFGRLEAIDLSCPHKACVLQNVGVDALDPAWTTQRLLEDAGPHSVGLKQFLLDQTHVAGLGNIYVCEILHQAGIAPNQPADEMRLPDAERIIRHTREILQEAIGAGGTTISDHQDALGQAGAYQHRLGVYGRAGEPCQIAGCSGVIEKCVQGGRSTYYCPECQS